MVTGYEAEFYANIKQMRKDFTEIRKDMSQICQYLNEKSINSNLNTKYFVEFTDSVSHELRRIADAMEDGKQ